MLDSKFVSLQARVQPLALGRASKLPPGYRAEVGGSVGESAKGQSSIFAVLPVTALIMLFILMIQLHSTQKLLLVMLTAPLGLVGCRSRCMQPGIASGQATGCSERRRLRGELTPTTPAHTVPGVSGARLDGAGLIGNPVGSS